MWGERLRVVGLCTVTAVAYGVVHDQVTVRLSPAYFLIAHRRLCGAEPATAALCWGVAGTWWVGAVIGALLAAAGARRPGRGLATVLGVAALASATAGLVAWRMAPTLPEALAAAIPPGEHRAFAAVWAAHAASYAAALAGGFVLVRRAWQAAGRAPLGLVPRDAAGWMRVLLLLAAVAVVAWRTAQ
jgi:hypothetical protein